MTDREIPKTLKVGSGTSNAVSCYGRLTNVVRSLVHSWKDTYRANLRDLVPMPSQEIVVRIIHRGRRILFPGYFTQARINPDNLEYYIGQQICRLFEDLSEQIDLAFKYRELSNSSNGSCVIPDGKKLASQFIEELPNIKSVLMTDVEAALTGDPAAKSKSEVIFSYPGFLAISIYRMAHVLHRLKVPFIPRIMTEHAHSLTGIDIHPGAVIGESFFIDHGTGVVIGETTEIGDRVRIYQGVTLGALSLPREAVQELRYCKRHPTVEDDCIIYSNTTILGGNTVIGARSVIGGNIWLTESVPPDTRVLLKKPELIYRGKSISYEVCNRDEFINSSGREGEQP